MPSFSYEEKRIRDLLSIGQTFYYNGSAYTIDISGKPTCSFGEPKTDVFVHAKSSQNTEIELKISFKKENADFLENKTNAERAEQLLGYGWKSLLIRSTESIQDMFLSRPLIFKTNFKRTEAGSITLGWKYEIVNRPSGILSNKLDLTRKQIIDVYAGTNLNNDKRDALVSGMKIPNSGVANCILIHDSVDSAQDVVNNIESIDDYVAKNPEIYFACKALNYRTFDKKWDGNRPLAVSIFWENVNGLLTPYFVFNDPLLVKGNHVANQLIMSMRSLGISSTDEIFSDNVSDPRFIHET